MFFIQKVLKKNGKVLLATKLEISQKLFDFVNVNTDLQTQTVKLGTKWIGGCISNF